MPKQMKFLELTFPWLRIK